MSNRLTGKTAFVTGAGSGIGRQVAARFTAEGARVVFTDRDLEAAAEAAGDHPDNLAVRVDIADETSIEQGFAAARAAGFEPNVVLANAGVQLFGQDAPIADLDLEAWNRTIAVNLTGTFLTVKHAVRAMLNRGGSIIITGSPTGISGEGKDFTAYSCSKAGVHGMARTVAAAYAHHGIRVNTVVPGYTETPLVTTISDHEGDHADIVARIPLGRPGRPSDVEGIMVYLASDESSFATGAIFQVDGGMTTL
jgi:NAD(P)-dependent dehydrogenase (short-subunit alcohol dehydrogenase family)